MVQEIVNIQFKLVNLGILRVRLFDVKVFQHVLNDYDTTRIVNEFLENLSAYHLWYPLQQFSRKFAEANDIG